MAYRLLLTAVAVAAALTGADAQTTRAPTTRAPTSAPTCRVMTEPKLCDTTDVTLIVGDQCAEIDFPETQMPPCCRLHYEIPNRTCQLPETQLGSRCRSLAIDAAACPPGEADFCELEDMTLRLDLTFQTSNETCCDKCNCYGDPHCESFDGKADTWIICDARTPTPDGKCAMSKAQCESNVDHLGNTCIWNTNPNGAKWVVATQGSPCRPTEGTNVTAPTMLMYGADDFSIVLGMGERAIIQYAIISDGGQSYAFSADLCFNDSVSHFPWREYLGQHAAPTDPNWLPRKSWFMTPLDGGDVLWSVFDLPSRIELSIRCTQTREIKAGKVRGTSVPRINIEQLSEPMDWRGSGPNSRRNVSGFCPNGTIHKLGTTSVTDNIIKNHLCEQEADELDVAKLLCGNPTTKAGIPGCKASWCKAVRLLDWEQCYSDIFKYGWAKVWCAVNTRVDHDPAKCSEETDNGGKCFKCFQDIGWFGWSNAMLIWQGSVVEDEECVPKNELPEDLVDCQAGVKIQFEASENNWVTYLSVPAGTQLCGGHLDFSMKEDPELFQFPIRIHQCSVPRGCLTDKCVPEIGFNASFRFHPIMSESANLLEAWNNKDLICDPVKFPGLPNPYACMDNMQPTGLCPCPAPSG